MVRIKSRYLLFNILYPPGPAIASTDSTKLQPPSYISLRRPSPRNITLHHVLSTLRHTISSLFGDHGLGVSQSSLKIVYFSPATSTCILRCPRAHFRLVWASLTFMDSLPGAQPGEPRTRCVIQVVRVSGTIRKSEEELLRRARRDLVRAKLEGTSEETALLEGLVGGARDGTVGKGKGKATETSTQHNGGDQEIEDLEEDDEDLDESED